MRTDLTPAEADHADLPAERKDSAVAPLAAPAGLTDAGPRLAAALAAAQKKCAAAPKDRYNAWDKYHYSSAEAIIATAKEALADTGLAVLLFPPQLIALGSGAGATYGLRRRVVLTHASGEAVPFPVPIEWPVVIQKNRGLDKAFSAAITTSEAYFLRDLLLMPRSDPEDDVAGRADTPTAEAPPAPAPNGTPAGEPMTRRTRHQLEASIDALVTELGIGRQEFREKLQQRWGNPDPIALTDAQLVDLEASLRLRKERGPAPAPAGKS